MAMQKRTITAAVALALIGLSLPTLKLPLPSFNTPSPAKNRVPNTGNVKVNSSVKIGIYQNSAYTTKLTSIGWGTLNPGSGANETIYLRNEGNVAVTLTIQTGNWTPSSAQNYLSISWDKNNYVLNSGATTRATLTLNVSSNIANITSFGFDMTITATP